MTPSHQKLIKAMQWQGLAERTQEAYVGHAEQTDSMLKSRIVCILKRISSNNNDSGQLKGTNNASSSQKRD